MGALAGSRAFFILSNHIFHKIDGCFLSRVCVVLTKRSLNTFYFTHLNHTGKLP